MLIEPFLTSIKELPDTDVHIDELPLDSDYSVKLEELLKSNNSVKRAYLLRLENRNESSEEEKCDDINYNRSNFVRSGWILFENRDYLLARTIFSYVLEKDENDVEALQGLGLCFLRLCNITAAKKCFKACENLAPSYDIYLNLAKCYIRESNYDIAINYLKKVCNSNEASKFLKVSAYKELGNCFIKQNKLDEALSYYYEGLKINPQSPKLLTNLGTLEYQRGHYNLALDFFEKAIEIDRNNSKAFCGMGLIALMKNELEEAHKYFLKSLEVDSQNSLAILNLIQIGNIKKSFLGIKPYILKFLEKDPDNHEIRFALASVYLKEGYYKSCEKQLKMILTKDPKHEKAKRLSAHIEAQRLKY